MEKIEFDKACEYRWKLWMPKLERYGKDLWRKYSLDLLMKLAENRLTEVINVYKETGYFDTDNFIDAMNFCDMILNKMVLREQQKGRWKNENDATA